jgi:transcriptional regulator with PAS, ATPase and Fis domain
VPEYGKQRDREKDTEALFAVARDLLTQDDAGAALDAVVPQALALLGGDRGFLVLREGDSVQYRVIRGWSPDEFEGDNEPISRSILDEVFQQREPLLIKDAANDPRFFNKRSVKRLLIRSVLAAPLFVRGEAAGALYLESRSMQRFFNEEELLLFQQILTLSNKTLDGFLSRAQLEQKSSSIEALGYQLEPIVTRDPTYIKLLAKAMRVAHSQLPILIQGESGTGKELVARAIHQNSPRAKGPFVIINCGAISPNLLESTLFGHLKGSFTGATKNQTGVIPEAHQGTLFLDEIGELPKELQAKMLRALQFGEVLPVGATKPLRFDVRFVAATNRDLSQEVREGRFREDLLYRLNAATVIIPPLRERMGDVPLLLRRFLQDAAAKEKRAVPEITPETERALLSYAWPGNIRELENEVNLLFAMSSPGQPITPDLLSPALQMKSNTAVIPIDDLSEKTLSENERAMIELHLKKAKGNKTHAAQSLGISREALRLMIKRYGIS